ncbi:hypothetical protein [Paraburkholderia oxyphila]|uniref:hypothetical protein n=1 Tax=Paraburkholderia oxyphila TaxID=614212 RepID=UPI0004802247|nr:hypothetical protein [Paraburkholderia oxyphila]
MSSDLKFAIEATYDKFAQQWDLEVSKPDWIAAWSPFLKSFTVDEIDAAADHCVKEFRRPPGPIELIRLVTRYREGKPLSAPIVSRLERLAYLLLTSDEFIGQDVSNAEIRDACLIAAAISDKKTHAEVFPDGLTPETAIYLKNEFAERARMFANVADEWQADASEGKGYWAGTFARK